MEREAYVKLITIAQEAFIRRASAIDHPFMLKGSFVTRQYFPKEVLRIPVDLDWVYLNPIYNDETARQQFSEWLIAVTERKENDGVEFRSFTLNQFWRRIDYAMSDDFPTVNTDLLCWVEGEEIQLFIDLSFNLDIENPPIPLMYQPLHGERFIVPRTAPLSLQVSWKIHQTLIRPRFKDIFDLTFLVQHPDFTNDTLGLTLQALVNECSADNIDLRRIEYFLSFEIDKLFQGLNIKSTWNYWRHGQQGLFEVSSYDMAKYVTDESKLPEKLPDFISQFKNAMEKAGFNLYLTANLPMSTGKPRIEFEGPRTDIKTDNSKSNFQEKSTDNIFETIRKLLRSNN